MAKAAEYAAQSQAHGATRFGRGALVLLIGAVLAAQAAFAATPPMAQTSTSEEPGDATGAGPRAGVSSSRVGEGAAVAHAGLTAQSPARRGPTSQAQGPPRPTLEAALQQAWRAIRAWAKPHRSTATTPPSPGEAPRRAPGLGLIIEGVNAQPIVQDGHAALSISGVMRNLEPEPQAAPDLRVSLINKLGRRVWSKRVAAAADLVPGGATRQFSFAILDPPASADQLEVVFERARRTNAAAPGAPAPTSP